MKTQIKYTQEIDTEEEINPIIVKIKCKNVEFIFEDGSRKKAELIGADSCAILENGKLRFNRTLRFD